VPVDNFLEWKKVDGGKQPYAIGLKGGGVMALAGYGKPGCPFLGRVRAQFRDRHRGDELCATLDNRMPVVLASEAWPAWPCGAAGLRRPVIRCVILRIGSV